MSTLIAVWKRCCINFIMSTFMGYIYVHCSFEKTLYRNYNVYIFGLCLVCGMMSYVYVHCSLKTRICKIYHIYVYGLCLRVLHKSCLRSFVLCLCNFMSYVYVHCSFEKTLYKLYHFYILGLCLRLWDDELCLRSLQFENYNV